MSTYTEDDAMDFKGYWKMTGDRERGWMRPFGGGIVYSLAHLMLLLEEEERGHSCKVCDWPLTDEDPEDVYCATCFHWTVVLGRTKQTKIRIEGKQAWFGLDHMGTIPPWFEERFGI